ncbi:MAG: hypothetical protein APF77_07385 [Clostridia bacterium BRH_c25]|nr:MAG: hypothetical protein APF77_07385 [Clostridia bacterium BRH_c25]
MDRCQTPKLFSRVFVFSNAQHILQGFLRYIRNFEEGSGEDYLKIQDEVYKDMSVDEIFEQASDSLHRANK